mmetsp:Transcript_18078/g.42407  ORF Transcript_18078/g.42407 Transcript_18078/m.42407 type:complete len:213 (-) Transcript_18078:455-1093(-)
MYDRLSAIDDELFLCLHLRRKMRRLDGLYGARANLIFLFFFQFRSLRHWRRCCSHARSRLLAVNHLGRPLWLRRLRLVPQDMRGTWSVGVLDTRDALRSRSLRRQRLLGSLCLLSQLLFHFQFHSSPSFGNSWLTWRMWNALLLGFWCYWLGQSISIPGNRALAAYPGPLLPKRRLCLLLLCRLVLMRVWEALRKLGLRNDGGRVGRTLLLA